jgi:hypothetical protein
MNKFILFICILFSSISHSQTVGAQYRGSDGIPHNLEFDDASGQPIPIGDHSNIGGSPLLQSTWEFGVIKLKNGGTYSDARVNYSLFNDKLFIQRNGKMYPFNYPVEEFSIEDSEDLNEKKIYHFKNGFPSINGKDSSTFYEILFEGNSMMLLKWKHKKIREIYNYGATFQSEYSPVSEFFVFFPKKNKMAQLGVRASLNTIRKNLPAYSNQIDVYNSTHTLNMKKDDDLVQLFSYLDSVNL